MSTKTRPTFGQIYMEMAFLMARRSTCRRLGVGCVITSEDNIRVLSVGYNGNAPGLDNDCDSDVPGACGCLHAEENATIACISGEPKVVYCTHLPCAMCAKRMLKLGNVVKVVYSEDYRRREGIEILTRRGIHVMQMARKSVPPVEFNEPMVQLRSSIQDPTLEDLKPPGEAILSAVFCGHANEVPAVCPCPPNCYCIQHTCKNRKVL